MSQDILVTLAEKEKIKIKEILKKYEDEQGNVISILQEIQEIYHYLPLNSLYYLSKKLNLPLAEIYSVATFYTQFKFTQLGKNLVISCDGTACHVKGGPHLLYFLENELGIKSGETTADLMFSIESVACLGCCAISPVCVINGQIYGELTLKKLKKILMKLKKNQQL
ncbi:MAG: NADH-quinone oxidoreductase subunit NuoE family protein [Promethearchaeota archaeon]|jgi:NADH:ubiquinone oxidoreductase subunit E